jgi:hypothetical protein
LKKMIWLFCLFLLISGQSFKESKALAASGSVKVSVAGYPITFNGIDVDNRKAEYPMLSYRDVTYLPMTQDYAKVLGLKVRWTANTGLSVNSNFMQGKVRVSQRSTNNRQSYIATIVSAPVTVNGKPIRNASEAYPLLSFRDVTYFPLTWRFTHDEFGWETTWSLKDGLRVVTRPAVYMYRLIYDDSEALYAETAIHDIYKIAKSLDRKPQLLSNEASEMIKSNIQERAQTDSWPLLAGSKSEVVRMGDSLIFQGIPVLSLSEDIRSNDEYYTRYLYGACRVSAEPYILGHG